MPRWTEISPNDPRLVPFNRQDDSDPAAPAWIYGGCGVRFRFTGPTLIGFFAKPHAELGSWIGVRIDGGAEIRLHIPAGHDGPILLACGLELGEHEALIYKRSDAWSRRLIFKGLAAQGDWLPGPNGPTRRVEFYGDSVLAGGMAEAPGFEGVSDDQVTLLNRDDEMTSPWFGWGWLTARRLGVEPHVLGVGGLALQDGTGWFGDPNMVGLATTWNTSDPNPEMLTPCDLSRFRPDAVVVGIGQNDGRTLDIQDAATRESWTAAYLAWLRKLREARPSIPILLKTTVLNHDSAWDDAVKDVARAADAEMGPVSFLRYRRAGCGTPGHPRVAEETEMADELAPALAALLPERP